MPRIPVSEQDFAKIANSELSQLGRSYHETLPLTQMASILENWGFDPAALTESILLGQDGRVHEQVGFNTWLSLMWHKMEVTGRYEVVAYLS